VRSQYSSGRFHFDPCKPDALQAQKSARELRGSHWRSALYCFISNGCEISSEKHREALLKEIEFNMEVLRSAAEYFAFNEIDKLENLRLYLKVAKIEPRRGLRQAFDGDERRDRPDIELIF